MGLDKSEWVSEVFAGGAQLERAPDSGPLRVSLNTQFESGIPPARLREELALEGGLERMETTLANVRRTEANLSLLIRGFKHLAVSALAARKANSELTQELDALRTHLTLRNEEEHALRFRTGQLEQLLDVIRHESSREREFLIEQQDLFLIEIMSDHERQIADMQRSIRDASARALDARQREIDELTAQRDQAREYATRCERERDAAWQELAASESAATPPTRAHRESSEELRGASPKARATAIGSISLRSVPVPASQAAAPGPERTSERSGPSSGYSLSRDEIAD